MRSYRFHFHFITYLHFFVLSTHKAELLQPNGQKKLFQNFLSPNLNGLNTVCLSFCVFKCCSSSSSAPQLFWHNHFYYCFRFYIYPCNAMPCDAMCFKHKTCSILIAVLAALLFSEMPISKTAKTSFASKKIPNFEWWQFLHKWKYV